MRTLIVHPGESPVPRSPVAGPSIRGVAPLCVCALAACTSFVDVRPAAVAPGPHVNLGVMAASPPGGDAAWFWSLECSECDQALFGPHASIGYGIVPGEAGPAFEFEVGVSGVYEYAQAYAQLRRGSTPFGAGVRFGLPRTGWTEDAVFARLQFAAGPRRHLLVSPALFRHSWGPPNDTRGSFVAFAPAIGLHDPHRGGSITYYAVPVLGRTRRPAFVGGGPPAAASSTLFLVLGMTLGFGY